MEVMDKIKIKCPSCGALLLTLDNPANKEKIVTCPNCKTKNKFKDFVKEVPLKTYVDDTELHPKIDDFPGRFVDKKTGISYYLSEGQLVVGRKPVKSAPKADIPILTDDMGMSRLHLKVKVILARDGHYRVYVSNAQNLNPTYINGELLKEDNVIGLKHGDIIKLSETELVYLGTPDNDITMI